MIKRRNCLPMAVVREANIHVSVIMVCNDPASVSPREFKSDTYKPYISCLPLRAGKDFSKMVLGLPDI